MVALHSSTSKPAGEPGFPGLPLPIIVCALRIEFDVRYRRFGGSKGRASPRPTRVEPTCIVARGAFDRTGYFVIRADALTARADSPAIRLIAV